MEGGGVLDKAKAFKCLSVPALLSGILGDSYNNQGNIYKKMGELEQTIINEEISRKALGLTHAKVSNSYNNLGVLYQKMGEFEQAKDYYQRALNIRTKALCPTHVDVGASYNNLRYVRGKMGEIEQAMDHHQRALEIRMKELGPSHADQNAGKLDKA